jgi:TRAP-type uncharacterized transport system fused permease subunit
MATIPTLLYYLSILIMIEGSAAGSSMSSVTSVGSASSAVAWRSYFHFTSLVLVAVLMVMGFTPFRAVYWATLAAVAMSWMGMPEDRLGPRRIVDALAAGGRDVLPVLATTAVAGIIVGVVTLTGLGLKAAGLIVDLAGASLPLTVFFAALAVWVLGLAVPVTASYIIAAVMVVPALTQVGVPLVAAHMFIFYYAVLSEVSPPTALAPFAAAALTGGRPFRTMMLTWKFALPAFLVPFAFALAPRGLGLLLQTDAMTAVETTLFACIGVFLLATALAENMERRVFRPAGSIAMAASGLLLLYPSRTVNLIGLAAGAISFALYRRPDASRAL